jgi:hypothetical protein
MPVTDAPARTKYTPPELAALWGVAPEKIIAFITSGELRAIDASTRRGGRPRYLIDVKDVADFERRRSVQVPARPARRRRQSPEESGDYF